MRWGLYRVFLPPVTGDFFINPTGREKAFDKLYTPDLLLTGNPRPMIKSYHMLQGKYLK